MKLKTKCIQSVEKETDIELPVYLYFQDEYCNDEYVKITDKEVITIKHDYFGFNLSVTTINKGVIEEHYLDNICSKEEFDEAMEYIIKEGLK